MGLYNETLNQNIDNLQVNSRLGNGGSGGTLYNYSEEEHIVGTWIDGKPVYEAIYTFSASNDGQWHTFIINENIKLVSFEPLPEIGNIATDSNQWYRFYDVSRKGFNIKINGYSAIVDGKIIIRYVKNS